MDSRGDGCTGEVPARIGLAAYWSGAGNRTGNCKREEPRLRSEVTPGALKVRGELPPQLIMHILLRHRAEARFCYELVRSRQPALEGLISLQFVIASRGNVLTSVVLSSTLGNHEVEQCLTNVVRRLEFPRKPGDTVDVTVPFKLSLVNDRSAVPAAAAY